jgi:Pyridoxamine 5'-phosphate oxidase
VWRAAYPDRSPIPSMEVMATWGEFAAEQPEMAARIRQRFDVRKHKTLATLRSDGSPRISGIEVEFGGDDLRIGMMSGSVKLQDLRRDPRVALHSPTEDPTESGAWVGEARSPAGWSRPATDRVRGARSRSTSPKLY